MPLLFGQASFGGRLAVPEVRVGAGAGFYPAISPNPPFSLSFQGKGGGLPVEKRIERIA